LHKVEPITGSVHSDTEIETVIASLGREPRGGLVVMNDGFKSHVPTIYYDTIFARDGGLLAYGTDRGDIFRRAAPYVDHLLLGAKPTELPVQLPAKFEMALNAKAAKTLGLQCPNPSWPSPTR
jgi:putative ABC transport system substrate-binding protein